MPSIDLRSVKMNGLGGQQIVQHKLKTMAEFDHKQQQQQQQSASIEATTEDYDNYCDLKAQVRPATSEEHAIPIFGQTTSSLGDQFAASLLRLQQQLDETSAKTAKLEEKLEDTARKVFQQQRREQQAREATGGKLGFLTNRQNLATVAYFTWPVLVYVGFRAIEKRSALAGVKLAASV